MEMTLVSMDWSEERKRGGKAGAELDMYANGSLRRVTSGMLEPIIAIAIYKTTLQFTTPNV